MNNTEEEKKNITEDKNSKKTNSSEEEKKEDKEDMNKNKNQTKNLTSDVILYGFERYHYDEEHNKIKFNTLFVPVFRKLLAPKIKLSLKIEYGNSLRTIEDNSKKVECKKIGLRNRQIKYYCEFTPDTKKIEKIEVEKIEFIGQKVIIKAYSPKAIKELSNLKNSAHQKKIKHYLYILESSEKKQNKNKFNIIGKINDKKFSYEEIVLTVMSQDNEKEIENKCSIEQIKEKYQISCEPKVDIKASLDGAVGKLENDEFLIINFKKGKDSSINFKAKKQEEKEKKVETSPQKSEEEKNVESKNDNVFENEGNEFFSLKKIIYIGLAIVFIIIALAIYMIFSKFKKSEGINFERHLEDMSSMEAIVNNNY